MSVGSDPFGILTEHYTKIDTNIHTYTWTCTGSNDTINAAERATNTRD